MISGITQKTNIQWHLSRIRTDNQRTMQQRYDEIAGLYPEITDTFDEVKNLSLKAMTKRILSEDTNTEDLADISNAIDSINKKRKSLLRDKGYPEDYLEPIYNCPLCHDEGMYNGEICSCVKRIQIDSLYKNSNLDKILSAENFDTFDLSYYSKECSDDKPSAYKNAQSQLNKAKNLVSKFGRTFDNILLYGNPGLGKTFLTNCIAKALLDEGYSVLYLTANELFEDILSKYIMRKSDNAALAELYECIFTSDLLIIDDLGTELMNSFVQSQFYEIVNRRILDEKATIISTNLSLADISGRYTERIMSRFVQHYSFYHLYGDNIRYQKRTAILNKNGGKK